MLSDLETYRAAPLGRTCASEHLLVWFPSATLRVVCAWGAPTEADIALLIEAMRAELQDLVPPHHSLVDVRDVRAVDGPAYERLFEFIRSEAAAWDRVTLSSRLVHSGGLVAGLLAGYKAVAGLAVRTSTHASLVDALDGLGPSASELEAGLRARRDAAALETRVLRAFRAWLEAHLVDADAETCAQTIGLSLRSLQRHLAEAGTTLASQTRRPAASWRFSASRTARVYTRTHTRELRPRPASRGSSSQAPMARARASSGRTRRAMRRWPTS